MTAKMDKILEPLMEEHFGLSARLAAKMTQQELNDIVYYLVGPEMGLLASGNQ
jgi:hypothetical protein